MKTWNTCLLAFALAGVGCTGDDVTAPTDGGRGDALPVDAAFDEGTARDATLDGGPDAADASAPTPTVLLPRTGISAAELAILINDEDPQSVALGEAYRTMRGVPAANVVHLSFTPGAAVMAETDFGPLYDQVNSQLGDDVQALAITWTRPFRVACMSITAAFTLGFDRRYCNTTGGTCGPTARVDYFDSDSTRPFTDHGIRPAVMLAATDEARGLELIARGISGDDTFPTGDGFLVRTTDRARSVRYPSFQGVVDQWSHPGGIQFTYVDNSDGTGSNTVDDTTNVLFYFTGLARVPNIETNTYLPGALADHLTSTGGAVPTSGQMSVVEWLEAGVTGSYGTVVEPCNYTTKFPHVPVLIERYFRGESLLEAYWKSVATPGEGLFVGEPLAKPFGAQTWRLEADSLVIETNAVVPSEAWEVQWAGNEAGPWTTILEPVAERWERQTIVVPLVEGALFYRLQRAAM